MNLMKPEAAGSHNPLPTWQSQGLTGGDGLAAPDHAMIRRLLVSLIRAEARQRRGQILPSAAFDGNPSIDEDGLGFDSLARLDLIGAVRDFFDLARTGIEDYVYIEPRLDGWIDRIAQHFTLLEARGEAAMAVFQTSGSTGTPQRIARDWAKLLREARGMAFDQGLVPHPGGAVIGLVPAHHLFGCLFTAILPSLAQTALRDLSASPPAAALRVAQAGDLLVATPHLWRLLLQSGPFPAGLRGVSSGAPMPEPLWQDLLAAGLVELAEIYGASETGGVGIRKAPGTAFTLLPFLCRAEDGRIHEAGSPLPVQDRLDWIGPDRFRLQGRVDRAVQVGGVNVSLDHVAKVLRQVPGVDDLSVRPGAQRLKAFIVCSEEAEPGLDLALRQKADAELEAPARPQTYRFGRGLPLSREGKLQDWD